MDEATRGARLRWLWLALALAPFVYLAADLALATVDLPLWDSWELVPLLRKDAAGAVGWADIWAQHNQHRLVFPRLVLLGLARASGWSVGWEIAFQVAQASLAFLALARAARAFLAPLDPSPGGAADLALPALSLLVFSQTQWENWVCGWQIQIWMSTAAATAGLLLLTWPSSGPRRLAAAVALGVVATYSFGTGTLFWPVGFVALLGTRTPERPVLPRLAAFSLAALATLGAYALGFERSPDPGGRIGAAWDVPTLLLCFFKYLGAAVVSRDQGGAVAVGALALALLAALPWLLVRRRGVPLAHVVPFVATGTLAVLAGALVSLGRAGFGSKMGMESRYVTLSTPLWCSLVVLLLALVRAPAPDRRLARLAALVLALVLASATQSALREARELRRRDQEQFEPARAQVVGPGPVELLKLQNLYTPWLVDPRTGLPTPAYGRLAQRIDWLRESRRSAFRK